MSYIMVAVLSFIAGAVGGWALSRNVNMRTAVEQIGKSWGRK